MKSICYIHHYWPFFQPGRTRFGFPLPVPSHISQFVRLDNLLPEWFFITCKCLVSNFLSQSVLKFCFYALYLLNCCYTQIYSWVKINYTTSLLKQVTRFCCYFIFRVSEMTLIIMSVFYQLSWYITVLNDRSNVSRTWQIGFDLCLGHHCLNRDSWD